MEFQYRAGDERRSPSPPPPTPLPLAAPSSSGSGSAGERDLSADSPTPVVFVLFCSGRFNLYMGLLRPSCSFLLVLIFLCDCRRPWRRQRRTGAAGQPPTPPPPVAADSADELRRQAEKAKIRERILREEAEQWELELEVRREIREELLRLSWPALGRSRRGFRARGGGIAGGVRLRQRASAGCQS
ncbi:hypothetical protein HU200_033619 [Digitaria exilis]|uniref:Uncharacterized protein n=1 Tax=Digitaria exilis TaxID=1010633 RepID=A0A835BKT7_9POAL|nr:hypothetical protein HU200_033619 [Digitaria exilis]